MKAFVLAAGLGTRLRPFTLEHPKALVPVGGMPMLLRVLSNLKTFGFDEVTVNIHHFGEQIIDFLECNTPEGMKINVSDERDDLLDTGGALLHANELLTSTASPILVHNVDILSNANLSALYDAHLAQGNDMTLLVSNRPSSRRLIFGDDMLLRGWHHVADDRFRPECFTPEGGDEELAFSGIYVISPNVIKMMEKMGYTGKFSIIDFMLSAKETLTVRGVRVDDLDLIDIGKPETLRQAENRFGQN